MINLRLAGQTIQQCRRDAKFDAAPPSRLNHHVKKFFAWNIWIRNDYFVGARFANGLGKIFEIADDGHTLETRAGNGADWAIIDDADDAITKLWPRAHLADAHGSFGAATDNQCRDQINPAPAHHYLTSAEYHSGDADAD